MSYKINFPDPRLQPERHRELMFYSWQMGAKLREAEQKKSKGNPFAMLCVPPECRPMDEIELYKIKYLLKK